MQIKSRKPDGSVVSLERSVLKLIALCIAAITFGVFGLSFSGLLGEIRPDDVSARRIAIVAWVIYFSAWSAGSVADALEQARSYWYVPRPKLPFMAAFFIVIISGLLYACFIVDFETLPKVLFVLWFVDYLSWVYMAAVIVRPSAEESVDDMKRAKDHYAEERVRITEYRVLGNWKIWRFIVGLALILAMYHSGLIWEGLRGLAPFLPSATDTFVSSITFLVFVLAVEVPIWFVRLKSDIRYDYLEDLQLYYELAPFKDNIPPDRLWVDRLVAMGDALKKLKE